MDNNSELSAQDLEDIKNFELDENCLKKLNAWTKGVNFFEITGIAKQEIRHSNFLAWLLDASESHGLGDKIIKSYLKRVVRDYDLRYVHMILDLDFQSFAVRREWNHLDICLVSDKEKFVIVIENKIDARESAGQTERYHKIINDIYGGYQQIFIFLTPDGLEASDTEWVSSTYDDIVRAIRENLEYAPDAVRMLLQQYINVLERRVIMNPEIKRICKEIYQKHKTAIDLIYEYAGGDRAQVYEWIMDFLKENTDEFELHPIQEDWCINSYIRFTSKKLYEKFGHTESNWINKPIDCGLVYEIYLPKDLKKVSCYLVASNRLPLTEQAILIGDQNRDKSHLKQRPTGKKFAHVFNAPKPLFVENDLEKEDAKIKLEQRLRETLTEAKRFEEFLFSKLNMD